MCEFIQLLYSNEYTSDQYSFNGQMRTGTRTGTALVTLMTLTFGSDYFAKSFFFFFSVKYEI